MMIENEKKLNLISLYPITYSFFSLNKLETNSNWHSLTVSFIQEPCFREISKLLKTIFVIGRVLDRRLKSQPL